jgi:hypothetical protein
MSALIIDATSKKKIDELIKYAEENPLNIEHMKKLARGMEPPPGDNKNCVCYLNFGYRVVFTIEQHPMGWCKHLSISIAKKEKYPSIEAVTMIMHQFNITGGFNEVKKAFVIPQGHFWVEKEVEAINIVQLTELNTVH